MKPVAIYAARDLFRRKYWKHINPVPVDENDPQEWKNAYAKTRFWTYRRNDWEPAHRWLPSIGGDEWCRWTIVLPIPFKGYLVIALWECRDPLCEACVGDCKPLRRVA